MKKILIVSQKEITEKPMFKQDKNLKDLVDMLNKDNEIDLLYLHKNTKISKEQNDDNNEQEYANINKFCIKDLISKNMLQKNLKELINNNEYKEIIFMSSGMAQFIMPYIEEELNGIIVVIDYRLSNLNHLLRQYREESQKIYPNFQDVYRQFRQNFLQSIILFQKGDYFIFDKTEIDTCLLEKENIKNIISVEEVKQISVKKENNIMVNEIFEIEINSDNFFIKMPFNIDKKDENKYVIYGSKYFNLVDSVNELIKKSKLEYFFIHKTKIDILPQVAQMLSQYLSFNKNMCVISPNFIYSRDNSTKIQQQYSFYMQRKSNYSNWEMTAPINYVDCFMLKKSFLKKYGYFDNKYKTIDYALFDFLMRVYQGKNYYCTAKDISIFKASNLTKRLELFKEDKQYLCHKWGENNFLF